MTSGIPAGSVDWVVDILRAGPVPMRRRKILESLEARGHRISLAGLNRILEEGERLQRLRDGPEGLRLAPPPTTARSSNPD